MVDSEDDYRLLTYINVFNLAPHTEQYVSSEKSMGLEEISLYMIGGGKYIDIYVWVQVSSIEFIYKFIVHTEEFKNTSPIVAHTASMS